MVRPCGKAKKIAYNIMGQPQNSDKKSGKRKKRDDRLVYEETQRVK